MGFQLEGKKDFKNENGFIIQWIWGVREIYDNYKSDDDHYEGFYVKYVYSVSKWVTPK